MYHPDRSSFTHRMTRRAYQNNYTARGIYHITIHADEALGQPFGQIVGHPDAPDGSPDAPHVALTPIGEMVEYELTHSISSFYPMIEIQDHVVMPEHLHFILVAHTSIANRSGRFTHLGQVIAGFKQGCNKRYWVLTAQTAPAMPNAMQAAKPLATNSAAPASLLVPSGFAAGAASLAMPPAVPPAPKPRYDTGRHPLFSEGYCDVMPLELGQLETQRAYINDNPRSRLLRTLYRSWLSVQRGGIATGLTFSALCGYLQRECQPSACTPEILSSIGKLLLTAADGTITCDTFGDRQLLSRPLLPVVCHRSDAWRFKHQKQRCIQAAHKGAILVSARIAKGEQDIMDTAMAEGLPIVLIADNGFRDRYHPSTDSLALCATHRLLIVTPWHYHYQDSNSAITVTICKAMNCLAQSLSRQKDCWWKEG